MATQRIAQGNPPGTPIEQARSTLLVGATCISFALAAGLTGCGGREVGPPGASFGSRPGSEDGGSEAAGAVEPGAPDSAAETSAAVGCSGPQDCITGLFSWLQDAGGGPLVTCCAAKTCIFGDQAANSSCDEPDAQVIAATSYDQSCVTDSDCALVAVGDFCHPRPSCPSGVISQSALPKYQSDVSQTYAPQCSEISSCPLNWACCRNGRCVMDSCFSPDDTLPECADAGGSCMVTSTVGTSASCPGPNVGPPDSCAYPDETCCLPSGPGH